MSTKKRLDIELMRILAAFFVIFNHTDDKGFFLFLQYAPNDIHYWIYLMFSVFCRFSVPLFFMIAGALMLDRESEPLVVLWKKRISHICFILVIWSFAYYCLVGIGVEHQKFNLSHFFLQLYSADWNYSYWYLYAYISFLIVVPFLQRFAKSLSNREYFYMLGLYGFFAVIIPVVQYFPSLGKININNQLPITWIMQWNVFFPLMGYFLENRARYFWTAKKILLLWVLDVLTLLVSCILTYFRANMTGVYDGTKSEAFHATFVIINAATIFVTCQYLYARYQWGERISKVIKSAGGCTFGIYLMHFYLLNYAPISVYIWSVLKHRFDTLALLCVFAYCGYVFLTSYVLTVALKKIPILRRLVS
jgi:putative acyltransferase